MELERSVRAMEANVIALESGNPEADDSEMKQKYDNQKQLNVQLQEQKRWLEHELEQGNSIGQKKSPPKLAHKIQLLGITLGYNIGYKLLQEP